MNYLAEGGKPFVDCGLGLRRVVDSLTGTVRVTAGSPGRTEHLDWRISYGDVNANEYDWNIQTADLNMLNLAFAVMKWKKMFGYYVDDGKEMNTASTSAATCSSRASSPPREAVSAGAEFCRGHA